MNTGTPASAYALSINGFAPYGSRANLLLGPLGRIVGRPAARAAAELQRPDISATTLRSPGSARSPSRGLHA
ncbi:hypothetical protein [Kibdelosporangium philippinense]|uniref:hypothetical protein n=1 Tax=Kibdelosporangium philippinense TaxID=211113 RepID=UPI00360B4E91